MTKLELPYFNGVGIEIEYGKWGSICMSFHVCGRADKYHGKIYLARKEVLRLECALRAIISSKTEAATSCESFDGKYKLKVIPTKDDETAFEIISEKLYFPFRAYAPLENIISMQKSILTHLKNHPSKK